MFEELDKFKLAIVGGRSFNDYELMNETLTPYLHKITEIVSGGAKGADYLAEKFAENNNIPITIFYAEWDKYGKMAGYVRNSVIWNYADCGIAFWDGKSKGTAHSFKLSKHLNKPIITIYY